MNLSPSFSSALRLTALAGVLLLGSTLSAPEARAESIGINFNGNQSFTNLAAGTSAGVVAQTNWNNIGGVSGTTGALNNDSGAATTTTLNYAGQTTATFGDGSGGDEQLNSGSINSGQNIANTFTLNNIAYGTYDIYVYNLAISGRQSTTLGSTSFFSVTPGAFSAGSVDNNAATPYIYTQATSTNSASPTSMANYVRFTGLSGNSQSFNVTGLNANGYVGGIQLVNTSPVPEPSTYAMMFLGVGALGLMTWKRKRSANSEADLEAI